MYICHWKNKKQPMIRKLLSLPPNLVESFHDLENASREEWFCTSDPVGSKLGSGGGTAWLLESCRKEENNYTERKAWLAAESRILLHAGGFPSRAGLQIHVPLRPFSGRHV